MQLVRPGMSLAAPRFANRHHAARRSPGNWTTGRALVGNTHGGFLWRVRRRCRA